MSLKKLSGFVLAIRTVLESWIFAESVQQLARVIAECWRSAVVTSAVVIVLAVVATSVIASVQYSDESESGSAGLLLLRRFVWILFSNICLKLFFEENPIVLISSGLLVQSDEGVSNLVVDRIDVTTAINREAPGS
ncbi:hypothetical protein F511_04520 [Dorcoceras hygrometricum]|uniref:Uncharacterized protein n=1 Tax=Dorcoceras hygrometricum TaxID=472368 RepID=A0A2Z7D5Y1_9LAMI|nr:hypothetical protein F511_04520 [Dorcoceras hygrometricum]